MDYPPVLEDKAKIRGPLRCDGVGGLLLAEHEGRRVGLRWFPPATNGVAALEAMRALPRHPALPAVVASGDELVCQWAAFELPEGRRLDEREPLSQVELVELGAALAGALAALHEAGIVHGELCAASVLLKNDGAPLLADVPLLLGARRTDRRGESRALSMLPAVAPYLSPERARGQAPSAAADVYALGAMLCGARPHPEVPVLELLTRIAAGARPVVPTAVTPAVRELLERMVSADPDARPTAAEVAAGLAPVVDPFEALLKSKVVSAEDLAPGHEPTIQEVRPLLPTVVVRRPSGPKPSVIVAKELDPPAPVPTLKEFPAPRDVPAPAPTAPAARPHRAKGLDFAQSGELPGGVLGWFAAKDARLAALAGTAAICLLSALTMLGEHHSRAALTRELAARPHAAAAAAREKQKQLEETPPAAKPAELRKSLEGAPDDY